MITFNKAKLSPTNEQLFLNLSIVEIDKVTNSIINVYIDTDETIVYDNKPSEYAIKIWEELPFIAHELDLTLDYTGKIKYTINSNDLIAAGQEVEEEESEVDLTSILCKDFSNHIFYIWAEYKGNYTMTNSDGEVNQFIPIAVIDTCCIYNCLMNTLKEFDNVCKIPKNFVNLYLQYEAIQVANNTGHFIAGKNLWNKFFKRKDLVIEEKKCNCRSCSI